MVLLRLMTGASVNTRFVLINWINLFRASPVAYDQKVLARSLKVSTRQLNEALDYLTEEGFLFRFKNQVVRHTSFRHSSCYSYVLRDECWHEWNQVKNSMSDFLSFQYVLDSPDIQRGKNRKLTITLKRLVMAVLASQADRVGYVFGCNEKSLIKMLGISANKLQVVLDDLSENGFISILSNSDAKSEVFDKVGPIYKNLLIRPAFKVINIGLAPIDLFPSINFLSKLGMFYRQKVKLKDDCSYPKNTSLLPDRYYYELSKIFENTDLAKSVYHLCYSVVFTIIPDYVAQLALSDASKDKDSKPQAPLTSKLRNLVRTLLSERLFSSCYSADDSNISNIDSIEPGSAESITFLRNYVVEFLSLELASVVSMISGQLKPVFKKYGSSFQVTGHLPNHEMVGLRKFPELPMVEAKSQSPEAEHIEELDAETENQTSSSAPIERLKTDFILTLLVPNRDHFYDSLIADDELIPAQSVSIIDTSHLTDKKS